MNINHGENAIIKIKLTIRGGNQMTNYNERLLR